MCNNVKIPMPDGVAQEWYMGITGSCGGLWQEVGASLIRALLTFQQKILDWKLEQVDIQPVGSIGPDTEGL